VFGVALWFVTLAVVLLVVGVATGNTHSDLLELCVVVAASFASVTCTGLFLVRQGGYRLYRGRRA
jgi:hypothetical protein